ncbi:MAG TPA: ABC transporter permease [Aggregatilineaceae bacterium]|nr:ABC transporter permease [Aggregatilineaceae bacterium]
MGVIRFGGSVKTPETSIGAQGLRLLRKDLIIRYLPLIVMLIVMVYMALTVEHFMTERNLINILRQASALAIMAVGMTAVLITGGIDLSIPSNMAFGGILGAIYMRDGGDPVLASLIMIGTCSLVGAVNGFSVAGLRMIPFVVTLSMMYVMEGAALWVTEKVSVVGLHQGFIDFVWGRFLGIPNPVIMMAVVVAIAWVAFHKSYYGRWLYAVGINSRTARVSGIPTRKVTFGAYVFSGLCAGIAAIIITGRLMSASAVMGQSGIVLDIVASAVVGGVSIYGGSGSPLGAALGAVLIAFISNSMNMMHIEYYTTLVIKGIVIITVIAMDTLRKR